MSKAEQSKLQTKSKIGGFQQAKKKIQQKTLEEQIFEMPLQNIEQQRLNRAFDRLCGNIKNLDKNLSKSQKDDTKDRIQPKDKFDKKEVIRILTELQYPYSKPQVDNWIWEVDEDLDGAINIYQFTLMYKRCIFDKTGLQPRNLFNLVQFMMYDQGNRGKITVQDTLQLIYVRYKDQLQQHIKAIFGDEQKTSDGLERQIKFEEYLKQIRKKDLQRRKKLQQERKTVTKVKKQEKD